VVRSLRILALPLTDQRYSVLTASFVGPCSLSFADLERFVVFFLLCGQGTKESERESAAEVSESFFRCCLPTTAPFSSCETPEHASPGPRAKDHVHGGGFCKPRVFMQEIKQSNSPLADLNSNNIFRHFRLPFNTLRLRQATLSIFTLCNLPCQRQHCRCIDACTTVWEIGLESLVS
jgi:hypothetical protein